MKLNPGFEVRQMERQSIREQKQRLYNRVYRMQVPGGVRAELDLIRRLLALRRARKVGPLYAIDGKYFISESEIDPYGTRKPYSLGQLQELIERLERESQETALIPRGGANPPQAKPIGSAPFSSKRKAS